MISTSSTVPVEHMVMQTRFPAFPVQIQDLIRYRAWQLTSVVPESQMTR